MQGQEESKFFIIEQENTQLSLNAQVGVRRCFASALLPNNKLCSRFVLDEKTAYMYRGSLLEISIVHLDSSLFPFSLPTDFTHYDAFHREKSKERINEIRILVRQTVQESHTQGDFPGRWQVMEKLPKPTTLLTDFARDAYQEAMLALSYGLE